MLNPIIGLALPAIAPVALIAKLPEKAKELFFKVNPAISSTALAFGTAHLLHFTGVLAPYAIIIIDLTLFPILLGMLLWRRFKKHRSEKIAVPA